MNKIRKGDEVIVRAGKDKGRRGTVLQVFDDGRVLVEGINLAKKHVKPRKNIKVMSRDIQMGFVAADKAWIDADVADGVIGATSQQYPLLMASLGIEAIAAWAKDGSKPENTPGKDFFDTGVALDAVTAAERRATSWLNRDGEGRSVYQIRDALGEIMMHKVGIFRTGEELEQAVSELRQLLDDCDNAVLRCNDPGMNAPTRATTRFGVSCPGSVNHKRLPPPSM